MPASLDVASCSGTAITSNATAASTSAATHDRRYPRREEKTTNRRVTPPARHLTLLNTAPEPRPRTALRHPSPQLDGSAIPRIVGKSHQIRVPLDQAQA